MKIFIPSFVIAYGHIVLCAFADYYDGLQVFDAGHFVAAAKEWHSANDINSLRSLGHLYEEGRGVRQSFSMAHAHYDLASARVDHRARKLREAVAKRMALEEIMRAQRIVEKGFINGSANSVSLRPAQPKRDKFIGDTNIKSLPSLALLDGKWNRDKKIPSGPCDAMSIFPMSINHGRVRAKFIHP